MRIVAGCFLIVAASIALAPSSSELRQRYGEPILERFTARPGINVTVEYGPDRLACEVRIFPARTLAQEDRMRGPSLSIEEMNRRMSSQAVTDILEEIAPVTARGKEINSGVFQASCPGAKVSDYENVSITRAVNFCVQSDEQDVGTTISFKRDKCPKSEPPASVKK